MVSHEQMSVRPAEAVDRRWPGYMLGFGVAMLLVSARLTTPVLLSLLAVWAFLARDRLTLARPQLNAVTASLSVLLGYALLSSLWAASSLQGLAEGAMAAGITLTTFVLLRLTGQEHRQSLIRLGWAISIGLAVGLTYFLAEELSGQAIKIWLYNTLRISDDFMEPDQYHRWVHGKLAWISSSTMSRNVAPITPLLWPALMTMLGSLPGHRGRLAAATIFALSVLVIFLSPHETSKVAIVAASAILVLASWRTNWAYRLVTGAWIFACMCIIPAALLAHNLELQNAPWLQRSAQHRIAIWNFTAKQVIKAPIFGSGIYTTYVRGPEISAAEEAKPGDRFKAGMSRHAHNVFLQTWFEFGLVGACLLLAVGLSMIAAMRNLSQRLQPFALAAFTSSMALMSSSYGMWQDWFLALFALTAVLFAIGARILDTAPEDYGGLSRSGPAQTA
ncbi:MAG: O-antigen ligase family protein [Hyphomicrobium sp.]